MQDELNETLAIVDRADEVHRFAGTTDSLSREQVTELNDWYDRLKELTASVKDAIGADGTVQRAG